ncbi:MAG: hypothetical protein R2849_06280 [Thermomicrobiales bacterium]
MGLNFLTDSSSGRGKWITLVLWFVIGGLVISLSPTLQDITTNDTLQFLPETPNRLRLPNSSASATPQTPLRPSSYSGTTRG